jgi:hypothetical protein
MVPELEPRQLIAELSSLSPNVFRLQKIGGHWQFYRDDDC